jgi:hypothetical protein
VNISVDFWLKRILLWMSISNRIFNMQSMTIHNSIAIPSHRS